MIISLKIKEKLLAKPSHLLLLNIIRDLTNQLLRRVLIIKVLSLFSVFFSSRFFASTLHKVFLSSNRFLFFNLSLFCSCLISLNNL